MSTGSTRLVAVRAVAPHLGEICLPQPCAGKLENAASWAAESTYTAIMGQQAIYQGKEMTWDKIAKG